MLALIVPIGVFAIAVGVEVRSACNELAYKTVELEAEVVSTDEYCEASKELRDAEGRVPFFATITGTAHLARIQRLELRVIEGVPFTMSGEPDGASNQIARVDKYRLEAEEWLQSR